MGSFSRLGAGGVLLVGLIVVASCATGVDEVVDGDGDGYASTVDCDDQNPAVNSEALEICDGIDNDCDGEIDELDAQGVLTWYEDKDADGHGVATKTVEGCNQPAGFTSQKGDCNDKNPKIHPGAPESCEEDIDYNCDGSTGYDDADADGVAACVDCDDQNPEVFPGAKEICNGLDDDCDGKVDADQLTDAELCGMVDHATVTCRGAEGCGVGSCDPTYYDVNESFEDGCECLADPLPETDGPTCAAAIDLGVFTDVNKDKKTITGNGVPSGRSIWYVLSAVDDLDTAGDEFHVDIRFTKNPDKAYAIDVYRQACPMEGEELAKGEVDVFDWFTDQNWTANGCGGKPCGEGNCSTGKADPNKCECGDDSAAFYFRVYRVDGLPSCAAYEIEISNGAIDAP